MSGPRDEHRRTRRQRPERSEVPRSSQPAPESENGAADDREWRRLMSELADRQDLPALDVSDKVLAKLGYRRASRRRARIAFLQRLGRRLGGVSLALGVLATGLFSVDWSTRAAAPAMALDQSIRASMREGSARLGTVAEGLRPVSELPIDLLLPIDRPSLHRDVEGAAPSDQSRAALAVHRPVEAAIGPRRQRPSIRVPQWPADALRFPGESVPTTVAAIAPLKNT